MHADDDRALLGELDGVADAELIRTWPSRSGSPTRLVGTLGVDVEQQLQALGRAFSAIRSATLSSTSSSSKSTRSTLMLAGLDLREVEDVVDDAEQVLARRAGSSST